MTEMTMKLAITCVLALAVAACGNDSATDSADSSLPDAEICESPRRLAVDALSQCTDHGNVATEDTDSEGYHITCTEYDNESGECLTEWLLDAPAGSECMTIVYDGVCRG